MAVLWSILEGYPCETKHDSVSLYCAAITVRLMTTLEETRKLKASTVNDKKRLGELAKS